jgi:thiol peroxidase
MPAPVERITISRDLPFAQLRFAKEGKLTGMRFLSDYRDGAFGRATGLLMEDLQLHTRAVILVDKKGVVRYLQVVPEVAELPDMERAYAEATRLAAE